MLESGELTSKEDGTIEFDDLEISPVNPKFDSTQVLIEERKCGLSEVKLWLFDKAKISNFITFLIMVAGIVLVEVYEDEAAGTTKDDHMVDGFKIMRALGLFGFSGGMTNWLAIRMMFDKIPCLFGSGILLRHFIEIRENVKKTTMQTYFDAGHLTVYVTQKTEIILNSLQLEESIREIIRSPAIQQIIEDKIDEVFQTPKGLVLGMVVNKQELKKRIMPSFENIGADIVPLISNLIRDSDQLTEDNLRKQIDKLITSKLVDMKAKFVIAVVKDMVETELGWVVVWGNIFGGLFGVALELVTILKD